MRKNLYVQDEFLSDDECSELILLFNDNIRKTKTKNKYRFLDVGENVPMDHPLVKKVWEKQNGFSMMLAYAKVQWAQIYEWPVGAKMGLHNDIASRHTVYTSVLYLNDDFEGGYTQLEDGTQVKAKKGRIFFYDGIHYFHRVTPMTAGTRYTFATWYKG